MTRASLGSLRGNQSRCGRRSRSANRCPLQCSGPVLRGCSTNCMHVQIYIVIRYIYKYTLREIYHSIIYNSIYSLYTYGIHQQAQLIITAPSVAAIPSASLTHFHASGLIGSPTEPRTRRDERSQSAIGAVSQRIRARTIYSDISSSITKYGIDI